MTLADEINAFLGYPLNLPSDARKLLVRAAARLLAMSSGVVKCPHGCGEGVDARLGGDAPVAYSCVICGQRWRP